MLLSSSSICARYAIASLNVPLCLRTQSTILDITLRSLHIFDIHILTLIYATNQQARRPQYAKIARIEVVSPYQNAMYTKTTPLRNAEQLSIKEELSNISHIKMYLISSAVLC